MMTRIAVILLAIMVSSAAAIMPPIASTAAYRQETISTTAKGIGTFTSSIVMMSVHGGDVRVRFDGVDPTATVGHLIVDGSFMVWHVATARRAIFIRTGDTDAVISITEAYQE